jgi:WD40 repeat protein/tRNA A-37 threonylcarbamoyl transferase component Bud32
MHDPQSDAPRPVSAPSVIDNGSAPTIDPAVPVAEPITTNELPSRLGRFAIRGLLGAGAFGTVYRAYDPQLEREVALKVAKAAVQSPERVQRFRREARAAAGLRHPHIVPLFETGEADGHLYLASAYVAGLTLEETLAKQDQRPLPPKQAAQIVRQLADALAYAHGQGVLHRDVKSANVLLDQHGEPQLLDFGLARRAEDVDRMTVAGAVLGTAAYLAPEAARGDEGRWTQAVDQYALGVLLYELLTGHTPFTGPIELVLALHQTQEAERPSRRNPEVPRDLEAICLKCLEKNPAWRYGSATELADDLGRFVAGEPVKAQPPSLLYLTGKFVRRHRTALAMTGVVLAILVGGVIAAFLRIDQERRTALAANQKLEETNNTLEENLYSNRIAVAERELTQNQDIDLAGSLLEQCPERLRGWEWHYLMRLRDGGRPPLRGHKAGLWTALFSPNGREIATASIDGTAKIWDAHSGKVLRTFTGHVIPFVAKTPPVTCLAYSPDGRHLATASLVPDLRDPLNPRKAFGVVKVWDPETLAESAKYNKLVGLVYCLAYSPDGKRIASSHINDERNVAVWDARTGQEIHLFKDIPSHTHRLRYSPDGRYLLAGCTDGLVRVFDADAFDLVRTLDAHNTAPIYDLAFSPDGTRFASSVTDGSVHLWETATGAPLMTLRGHTGAAMGVTFSPDGKRIATGGFDNTVRLWDAATGVEKITLRGHSDMVSCVDFSPDGQRLVSASFDREARIWDASPVEESGGPGLLTFAGHTDRVNTVVFSADGERMASGSYDKTVRIWDSRTGRTLHTLQGHKGPVWGLAFRRDGKRLASAAWDQTVKIWDTESGQELLSFARHGAPAHGVAYTPDGKRLISTSWEGLVKVWDPDTGKEILTYAGHLMPTLAVAVSPDGKLVATGSGDRTVKVWEANTGRDVFTLREHEGLVHGVAFSPNGKLIATASWDHKVRIWDAETGKMVRVFDGHGDRVQSLAFSPDGSRIASASEDKTVRIWEVATGRETQSPCHHRGVVWSVAFSPDGQRVAAGCWSSYSWVKTWKVE